MKKKFIATLLLISIISLTACNNIEPVTESTIESSVETEESIAENTTTTESVVETTTIPETAVLSSETTAEEQTEEIYLQEDGTYYVSDELCQKFREYSLFSDWTDEENDYLVIGVII